MPKTMYLYHDKLILSSYVIIPLLLVENTIIGFNIR